MPYPQELSPDRVIFIHPNGTPVTASAALNMIDAFLRYIENNFQINTEPFLTAIKAVESFKCALTNRPSQRPTKEELKSVIDALEKISKHRNPDAKQQIEHSVTICKMLLDTLYII